MRIRDVFSIAGKTIFAGDLETRSKYISNTPCRLLIDGDERCKIVIEGEVLDGTEGRCLWTESVIPLSRDQIVGHVSWLMSEQP
jgi:hypothetical protein